MKTWILLTCITSLLFQGCAKQQTNSEPKTKASANSSARCDAPASSSLSITAIVPTSATDRIPNYAEGSSFYWPAIPTEITLPVLGPKEHLVLLPQAKDVDHITRWCRAAGMRKLIPVDAGDSGVEMRAIADIGTSGRRLYWIYLYGNRPSGKTDPMPWKLLYLGIGIFEPKRSATISSMRLDCRRGDLEILDAKAGRLGVVQVQPLLKTLND